MQELIQKIEQWAHDRNIINGSKPIDQAMKLFSEFGELADNVGKGRDCRDDVGDCLVVATIICAQRGFSILRVLDIAVEFEKSGIRSDAKLTEKEAITYAAVDLAKWVECGCILRSKRDYLLNFVEAIMFIANNSGNTLKDCLEIAYDDIKDRKGKMKNGVFIKESDLE